MRGEAVRGGSGFDSVAVSLTSRSATCCAKDADAAAPITRECRQPANRPHVASDRSALISDAAQGTNQPATAVPRSSGTDSHTRSFEGTGGVSFARLPKGGNGLDGWGNTNGRTS